MKPLLILGAASIVLVSVLCTVVNYYHDEAQRLEGDVKRLQSDNSLQANTIATQAFQFQRANEISSAATQYGINTSNSSLAGAVSWLAFNTPSR